MACAIHTTSIGVLSSCQAGLVRLEGKSSTQLQETAGIKGIIVVRSVVTSNRDSKSPSTPNKRRIKLGSKSTTRKRRGLTTHQFGFVTTWEKKCTVDKKQARTSPTRISSMTSIFPIVFVEVKKKKLTSNSSRSRIKEWFDENFWWPNIGLTRKLFVRSSGIRFCSHLL